MNNHENWQYPDTKNWAEFPFSVDGVNFVSKLDKTGKMFARVLTVPAFIFEQMNQGAVANCIGDVATMTKDEIIAKLAFVNENANEAVIELA